MLRKTMHQKRQSVVKTKNEVYPQKSVNLGNKTKPRSKTSGSKIKVVVRKRPINESEKKRKDSDIITVKDSCTLYIDEPRYKVDMTKYNERHEFIVDKVFNETVDNYTVYVNTIKPLLLDMFENNCVCSCFAYGQTGSGKTYTMLGAQPYGQSNTPGIFQYAANDIFQFLKVYDPDNSKGIFISFYEIYCGKLYDLLQKRKMVAALENGKKEVIVKDLKVLRVLNKDELIMKMIEGVLLRKIGVNSQNDESSRSHAILNIDLKDINKNSSLGKIAFIDLAGSERGADTITQNKQTQTDGANINRSLLALKECIRAMDAEKNHIPFRDSELTKVLRDIFVGKSKSIMIANVSPTISCCEQTLNTLRYSSRVKNFKTKPILNEEDDAMEDNKVMSSSYDYKSMDYENSSNTNQTNTSGIITNVTNANVNSVNYNYSNVNICNSNIYNTNSNNFENTNRIDNNNNNKINIKINEVKNKNSTLKIKNTDKMRENVMHGKTNISVDMDNQAKKKKKSVPNYEKNTYDYGQKKPNTAVSMQNYTFTDTSDFSSIDEMNYNLNNNDQNIFMNNKNDRLKNRSSCGSNSTTKPMKNQVVMRYSVGNRLNQYDYDSNEKKDKNYLKNHQGKLELPRDMQKNGNTNNLMYQENNELEGMTMNQMNMYMGDNTASGGASGIPQFDYQMMKEMNVDDQDEMLKIGMNHFNPVEEQVEVERGVMSNFSNGNELHTKNSMNNAMNQLNSMGTMNYLNMNTLNSMNNMMNLQKNQEEKEYGSVNMDLNNTNSITGSLMNASDLQKKQMSMLNGELNNSSLGVNHMNSGNSISGNNDYFTQVQNNINSILNNSVESLNLPTFYEDTQHILNHILLSNYKADKENIIKRYINVDISTLSLEELDKYAQLIYEKRKEILNKLLILFKKNVDIQTDNETSDLKKDLVMCHICSNNPDDQFHYYVYSRLEKDMTNLVMLRQIWCESENLRLLHQYLSMEYQNKSANSIMFNVSNQTNGSNNNINNKEMSYEK